MFSRRKIPRKCHNHEVQASRGTKRRHEEHIGPNKRHICNHRHTKKNCNNGTALERLVEKNNNKNWGLKPVLLARNLTLNSASAPNYKYMFGSHRRPLIKTTVIKQSKGLNGDLKPEHKKAANTTTMSPISVTHHRIVGHFVLHRRERETELADKRREK